MSNAKLRYEGYKKKKEDINKKESKNEFNYRHKNSQDSEYHK